MKILGICGSSRKHGNTASIIRRVLEGAKSANEAGLANLDKIHSKLKVPGINL